MDTENINVEVSSYLMEEIDEYSKKLELNREDTINVLLSFAVTHFSLNKENKESKGLFGKRH